MVQQKSSREDAKDERHPQVRRELSHSPSFSYTGDAAGVSPAVEMAMTRRKMDLRQSEMRPLSLMRQQITAAKVFDGDQNGSRAAGVTPRGRFRR